MRCLGVLALLVCGASAFTDPIIIKQQLTNPGVDGQDEIVLSCNLTNPPSDIKGRVWRKDGADIPGTVDEDNSSLMQHRLQSVDAKNSGLYSCVYLTKPLSSETFQVKAAPGVTTYKKSEHGNEGDVGLLTCKSHGYPPVESWTWSRSTKDGGVEHIMNGTNNRFQIKITGNGTELRILALDIEKDQGEYYCNATNEIGARAEIIHLRVRGRFAALWPFLGIVAEVIVLVAIIFIYEKRRKPDELADDDEQGSAPLKSNAATNHKDKNVRQRNAN
ncbi:basigin [Callorhinchus milii]|uniref:Basigin n=1 Tax=Callorhinchus milii TaxID=7868 RepID=V9KF13_CALMI|nr:basigin [Callorhinchus milii]|eukprot:gi/632962097/ref/XP_007897122.1/ PREDICTED: basigin [Callorhinchus milii]